MALYLEGKENEQTICVLRAAIVIKAVICTKAPDADNVAACSGVELSLEVTFSNDCTKALVVFSLTNATDKICRIVETSFPEKDFDLAIASADNSPVPLRKDALIEEVRRSETLRRVAVDVMPHSEYRRHGDFLSFYELKQNSWYVARGTCTVFQKKPCLCVWLLVIRNSRRLSRRRLQRYVFRRCQHGSWL